MTTFGIGQAAELLCVSPDTVRRWVDTGVLAGAKTAGGHRMIEGADLAAFAESNVTDTATLPVTSGSARNRLIGLVTKVTTDTVMAQVEMVCGPFRIVSLISSEAVRDLGLEPGVLAVASVKATNVVIEIPNP